MLFALSEEKSIAKVADRLYVSRQAIMKQLDSIESELGFSIFERSYKGVTLTESGRRYIKGLRNLKNRYETLLAQCVEEKHPLTIRIPNKVFTIMDVILKKFREQYPELDIRITEHYHVKNEYEENPQPDIINLFADPGQTFGKDEMFIPLLTDPFICLVSQTHPLSGRKTVTREELARYQVAIASSHYQKDLAVFLKNTEIEELGFDTLTVINICYRSKVYITHACYRSVFPQLCAIEIENSPVKVNGLLVRKKHRKEVSDFIEFAKKLYPTLAADEI